MSPTVGRCYYIILHVRWNTCFEHVHVLQVGGHTLQSDSPQVALRVGVVPEYQVTFIFKCHGRSSSWKQIAMTLFYSLFGKGKLLDWKQRRISSLSRLFPLQDMREKLLDLDTKRSGSSVTEWQMAGLLCTPYGWPSLTFCRRERR